MGPNPSVRVGILTAHLSDASGGLSACIPPLADSLATECGIDCQVVGIRDVNHPDAWQRWGANVHALGEVGPHAIGFSPDYMKTVRELSPNLIDAQGLWMYPSLVSLRYSRQVRRPYVITPHGMLDPWAIGRSVWKKRLVSWCFESVHLRQAACLRATAPMEGGHFRAYGLNNPIAVIPNGTDLPALAPRSSSAGQRSRLLFLSRLHPKKGIDHLLRAWARLRHHHADWQIVIAGPDELGHRAQMQCLANSLGLADVVWHNAVQGEEKSTLYRSADLFVLPTHAENFGLVIAEALAHEVPVITTRNAPWDGLERHRCGWWIELSDDALVAALNGAMALSDAERQAMGERGRTWMAKDFTWPAIARQMHEVYTWVLGGGPPPACVMTD